MMLRQQIQIDTINGREVLAADRYAVREGMYIFLNGDEVVRTVPVDDIVVEYDKSGEQTKGIATIYSRT